MQWTIVDDLEVIPKMIRRHAITILILHGGDDSVSFADNDVRTTTSISGWHKSTRTNRRHLLNNYLIKIFPAEEIKDFRFENTSCIDYKING